MLSTLTWQDVVALISIGTILVGIGVALGQNRSTAKEIGRIFSRLNDINHWRSGLVENELDKIFVRRETLEIHLDKIQETQKDIKDTFKSLADSVKAMQGVLTETLVKLVNQNR